MNEKNKQYPKWLIISFLLIITVILLSLLLLIVIMLWNIKIIFYFQNIIQRILYFWIPMFVLNLFFSFIIKSSTNTTDISLLWKIAYWVIFLIWTLVVAYLLYVSLENNIQVSLSLDDIVNLFLLLFIVWSLGWIFYNNVLIKNHISLILSLIVTLLTIGMLRVNTDWFAWLFVLYYMPLWSITCITLWFYYWKACRWIVSQP